MGLFLINRASILSKEKQLMSSQDLSYALANPISVLINKPPQDFKRADFLKIIEQRRIERITFHYTALDGKL
jgi:hypothetical protein